MTERNGNGHTSYADMLTMNRMEQMLTNASTRSLDFFKSVLDPRRSIEDECGLPAQISLDNYRDMYQRDAVATRVVEFWPKECWAITPEIFEDEDPEVSTPFEEAWEDVGKQLRGEHSWLKSEDGNPVWELLARADELSGIGSFGVILLGFDDGEELNKEIKFTPGKGDRRKLLYARALSEPLVQVQTRCTDRKNPRFGLPETYNVTLESFEDGQAHVGTLPANVDFSMVHWTRVLHIADVWHTASESDVFAVPRMRSVYNHLHSIRKVYYGDAEAYWKNVLMKIFFETQPQLGGDVNVDTGALKDMMEAMGNGLQGWGALMGMSAKTVAPSVVDPKTHIDVQIDAICLKLGVSRRSFIGSQEGQMGGKGDSESGDDRDSKRVMHRMNRYLTPRVVGPFVDRLISVGVLPVPDDDYTVIWDQTKEVSDKEQAEVCLTRTQALVAYISGNGEALVAPMDYLTKFQGLTDDEAEQVLESTQSHMEEAFQDTDEDVVAGHVPAPPTPELPAEFGGGSEEEKSVETEDDTE